MGSEISTPEFNMTWSHYLRERNQLVTSRFLKSSIMQMIALSDIKLFVAHGFTEDFHETYAGKPLFYAKNIMHKIN